MPSLPRQKSGSVPPKGPRRGAGHQSTGPPSRAFAKMRVAREAVLAKERGTRLMSESEMVCPKLKRRRGEGSLD